MVLVFAQILLIQTSPMPGGDSHMKQTGMLVVSHRGVNFGFWSRLACSGQSANILCRERHKGLIGRGHDLRLSLD